MDISAKRGNKPELWSTILTHLDDRLQLGLLDRLRRVNSYELEENRLIIEPGTFEDEMYLRKDAVYNQLRVLAGDALDTGTLAITIRGTRNLSSD